MPRAWLALALPPMLAACAEEAPRPLPPPVLVAEAPTWVTSLAVDDDFVYWTDGPGGEAQRIGRVMRVPRAGGVPEVLADHRFNPGSLLAGADTLYWLDYGDLVSPGALFARDKANGTITPLVDDPPASIRLAPLLEYDGKLIALGDDAERQVTAGRLFRLDPRGATAAEATVRFPVPVEVLASRSGPSLYLVAAPDCSDLRVFRADLSSEVTAAADDFVLERGEGFVADRGELFWTARPYVDRSELHHVAVSGAPGEPLLGSYALDEGVLGAPLPDGDALWFSLSVRVDRQSGAAERFTPSLAPTLAPVVRPEGLYVAVENRIYLQPRP